MRIDMLWARSPHLAIFAAGCIVGLFAAGKWQACMPPVSHVASAGQIPPVLHVASAGQIPHLRTEPTLDAGGATGTSVSLQCRLFGQRYREAREKLLPSVDLFVPWQEGAWPDGLNFALIWDAESLEDQNAATLLSALAPYPRAFLEELPPNPLPDPYQRGIGYSRQQYSNFYADLYAGGARVVGMLDSDTMFISPLVPAYVFPPGEGGRVLFTAYSVPPNTRPQPCDISSALGGKPFVVQKMVNSAFPVFVRVEHFALMREHMRISTGSATFEEAFSKTCCCQFDMMANYLWHFQRDAYVWRIKDVAAHPKIGHRIFHLGSGDSWAPIADSDVAAAIVQGPPVPLIAKNGAHAPYAFTPNLADLVCLAARTLPKWAQPGTCERQRAAGLLSLDWERVVLQNFRSDNEFWREPPARGRYPQLNVNTPDNPEPIEPDWEDSLWGDNITWWTTTYEQQERHFLDLGSQGAAFPWMRGQPAELIRPWLANTTI